MRVVLFTQGKNIPSARFRVLQYIPYLQQKGIKCIHCPSLPALPYVPSSPHKILQLPIFGIFTSIKIVVRLIQIPLVLFADIVVIQKELTPYNIMFLQRLIWFLNRNIIFDFDDAIYLKNDKIKNPLWKKIFGNRDRIAETIKLSKAIIVGNNNLARYAKRHHHNVNIIPTVIDTDKYVPKDMEAIKDTCTIGWMGTSSNIKYLTTLASTFQQINQTYPNVKLQIVTDRIKDHERDILKQAITFEVKKWSKDQELQDLQSFDIGIMPLEDTPWAQGKCGFKLIQYMATGIPAIASPVGINKDIVKFNTTGFLASSKQQWFEALSALIENKNDLRARIARNARDQAVKSYSLHNASPKLLSLLQEIALSKKIS